MEEKIKEPNIVLELYHTTFESDIRALVMAFYPGCLIHTDNARADRRLAVRTDGADTTLALYDADAPPGERGALLFSDTFTEPAETANDRLRQKSLLKRHLYRMLEKDTGRQLLWGTLTGIRPVKLPYEMRKQGMESGEIAAFMKAEYFISDEKCALALEISARELALLGGDEIRDGYSLYVGIPFCPTTCAYCSFPSYPLSSWQTQTDAYLDALEKELTYIAQANAGRRLDTIYIGGGTPTTLSAAQLTRLCELLTRLFPMETVREWSVEAGRPDSVTKEKLAALTCFPVTRISVNPQTMKDETLVTIGRRHTVAQTIAAFHLARESGFDNINMDMILGLPGETKADVENTLAQITALAPDSLTVHALAHKRAARMTTQREAFAGQKSTDTQELHALVERAARKNGLLPYYLYRQKNMEGNLENVGYAREGKFCLYNILIMEKLQSIFAAGAGAATKLVLPDGSERRAENVKNVGQYMARIDEMIARKRAAIEEK